MENYVEISCLGEGAYGKVVKCRSTITGGLCAIKIFTETDTESVNIALERELYPLKTLKHHNIVKLFEVFLEKGVLYGVFELLHHSILDELLERGQGLASTTLKKYIFQLLRGVAFLHSCNIIHRDIKPDNLLVSGSGVVKLADMGFSREVGATTAPLTGGLGTLPYMAPELLLGDPNFCKPVDVWAIGCTIMDMEQYVVLLTGNTLVEQLHEMVTKVGPLTQLQTQQYLANADFASVELPKVQLPADLMAKFNLFSRPLAQLVDSCLQMDPASRSSCLEILGHEYFTRDQFNKSFTKELEDMVAKDQLGHGASVTAEDQEPTLGHTWSDWSLRKSDDQQADVQYSQKDQFIESFTKELEDWDSNDQLGHGASVTAEGQEPTLSHTWSDWSLRKSDYQQADVQYSQKDQFIESFTKELEDWDSNDQLGHGASVTAEAQEPTLSHTWSDWSLWKSDDQQADVQAVESHFYLEIESISNGAEEVGEQVLCDAPSSHPSGGKEEDQVEVKKKGKSFRKAFSRVVRTIGGFFTSCVSLVG